MSVSMVRCGGCGEVVDGALRTCPRCGAALHAVVVMPDEGSYAERYRDTMFAAPAEQQPIPAAAAQQRSMVAFVIAGVGLLVVAAIVGGFVLLSGSGSSPTPGPGTLVKQHTPSPTPGPTLPSTVATTIAQLSDPDFSAKITINGRASFDRSFYGQSQTLLTHVEVTVSGGNEVGKFVLGSQTTEFKLLGNQFSSRVGTAAWSVKPTIPTYLQLTPLFGVTTEKMLKFVGQETKNGQALNHLVTTNVWGPDPSKVAVIDLSNVKPPPESSTLDLWVTPDGLPVTATYTAKTDTADGARHLLFIQTTYDFTNVGEPIDLTATPSPSVKPSGSVKPSASTKPSPSPKK